MNLINKIDSIEVDVECSNCEKSPIRYEYDKSFRDTIARCPHCGHYCLVCHGKAGEFRVADSE